VIYAGGLNEFGYLTEGQAGQKEFHSLSSKIPDAEKPFTDVWKI